METYGKKPFIFRLKKRIVQLFTRREGWICLNMAQGHKKQILRMMQHG